MVVETMLSFVQLCCQSAVLLHMRLAFQKFEAAADFLLLNEPPSQAPTKPSLGKAAMGRFLNFGAILVASQQKHVNFHCQYHSMSASASAYEHSSTLYVSMCMRMLLQSL